MPTNKQRITINLSDGEYGELAALAEKNNVSMAWIGRKAIIDLLQQARGKSVQLSLTFAKRPDDRPRLLKRDATRS